MASAKIETPSASTRDISFGVVARLLAIALGIVSTAHMAVHGFEIPLTGYLDRLITLYDEVLSVIAGIVEPTIRFVFLKVREWYAIDLHLFPHWKHAFVLLSLYFAAQVRAGWTNDSLPLVWGKPTFDKYFGFACAVLGGVLAGTTMLSSPAIFVWALVAYLIYWLGQAVWWSTFFWRVSIPGPFGPRRRGITIPPGVKRTSWMAMFKMQVFGLFRRETPRALIAAAVGFAGYVLFRSPSPGLVALLTFIVMQALVYLKVGYQFPRGKGNISYTRLNNPATRTGLDILAVLGGAAFLVWFAARF